MAEPQPSCTESQGCERRSRFPLSQTWQDVGQALVPSPNPVEPEGTPHGLCSEAPGSRGHLPLPRAVPSAWDHLPPGTPLLHSGLSLTVTSPSSSLPW